MGALSPADRTKLARILGMLGSDHDGERAAAGLKASRIVRAAGVSWGELLLPEQNAPRQISDTTPSSGSGFMADMALCQRHRSRLTAWEMDFVCSLVTFRRRSPKQLATLAKIANRLRMNGQC